MNHVEGVAGKEEMIGVGHRRLSPDPDIRPADAGVPELKHADGGDGQREITEVFVRMGYDRNGGIEGYRSKEI